MIDVSKRCMGCMELYGDDFEVCPHCGYYDGETAEEAIHMDPNTILHDRYIIGRVIGYGGFGVTYIGWDGKLEQKVAIKEYFPSEFSSRIPGQTDVAVFGGEKRKQFYDGMEKFVDEAKRLAQFQNEDGIVRVYDSFTENETAYIIMEYLDGETLKSLLEREKTIPEDKAINMLIPVMKSLKNVHEHGIIHRDIAPDNIFITKSGDMKLIDFGASRYATTSHSRSLTVVVKQGYSPEEQYRSRGDQGPHTDVYSLAATLYKMITGKTPPDAMERRSQKEGLNKEILIEPHLVNGTKISVDVENAILNAMNVRIEDRTPDIDTFINELTSDEPVKRRVGKIKKIDVFAWPLWLKITLPIVFCSILIFGGLLATGVIHFNSPYTNTIVIPTGYVEVPDVEGYDKDKAINDIENAGLIANVSGTIESEYIDAGKIIMQTPMGASYLQTNGTVELILSSGGTITRGIVPFVEGDSLEDALNKLEQAGLGEPKLQYENSDSTETGHIISQSIPYDTKVNENTIITLIVSKGPRSFELIDVTGMNADKAISELQDHGLMVEITYEENDSANDGEVLRQTPSAHSEIKRGDTVNIVVCTKSDIVTIPDVVGKTQDSAEKILKDSGLKVFVNEDYSNTIASGKVISQSPSAGEGARKNDTITITVSKGKKTTTTTSRTETMPEIVTTSQQATTTTTARLTTTSTTTTRKQQQSFSIELNANGGTVSQSSITVTEGSSYGPIPLPTRPYYTFTGWYTSRSGGRRIDSGITASTSDSRTLYAHWSENSQSGWTLESNAPSNAKIVSEKWTYDETTTVTSSNSSMNGYTMRDWSWGNYGSWSNWQNSFVASSDSRDVETQDIQPTYRTEYNYSRYKNGSICGPIAGTWSGVYCGTYEERGWGDRLPVNDTQYSSQVGGWFDIYEQSTYQHWFNETSRQVKVSEGYTQYRYRDRSKIYTFSKTESKESYYEVSSSSTISNVQKWVKYIPY